jgi:glycosyltransferase involved in cell wall biosynthesis
MGADYIGEAIQSVLGQSYTHFELIVVNDASPDYTTQILEKFDDPRFIYIVHENNRGADTARNTGLQASSGEIIAFLDQDDFFHPDKLRAHVTFLNKHPKVGFTYNARFELNYSATTVRDLWRPNAKITLADLVLWFPLSPTDVVLRRNWALQMDLTEDVRGSEIVLFGQLYLAGCKFGYINRALNYRRHHSGRVVKDLVHACQSEIGCQTTIFSDPRFPTELKHLRDIGHANIYLYWSFIAFSQQETQVGQSFLRKAVQLNPSIVQGTPCELVKNYLINGIDDENIEHEVQLSRLLNQLPPEMSHLDQQFNWAVSEGYLLRGARAAIWGRSKDAQNHFKRALSLNASFDDYFLVWLTKKLHNYEEEYGIGSTQNILHVLEPYLKQLDGQMSISKLKGKYSANRAFYRFQKGDYNRVAISVMRAIINNPTYLFNRGIISIFLRSTLRRLANISFEQ